MASLYRCISFKGTYLHMILPSFVVFLVLLGSIFYVLFFDGNVVLTSAIAMSVFVGLMIFFSIRLRKYTSHSFEMTDSELRFLDKNGKLKFTIPYSDIQSIRSSPFFSFNDLTEKVAIRLKSGGLFSILVNEDSERVLFRQLEKEIQLLDVKPSEGMPVYMHVMFGVTILLLLLVGFLIFVKKDIDIRLYLYAPVLIAYIVFYLNKRKKLKNI